MNYIKHITIISLLAVFSACSEISVEENSCTGLLGTPVFDVDLSVDVFTATKAAAPSLPELSLPETGEFNIKVVDKDGNTVWNQKGFWSEPLTMPVGSYTAEATYGSNTFGEPFYQASCTGTISALKEETPSLKAKLKNALLAVYLSDGMEDHFSASEGNPVKITVSGEETALNCGLGKYVYVPAGKAFVVTVDGNASTGVANTLSWNLEARSEGTATCVSCGLNSSADGPSITISPVDAWGTVAYISKAAAAHISEDNLAFLKYSASADGWATSVTGSIDGDNVKFSGLTPGTDYKVRAEIGALRSNELSIHTSTEGLSAGAASHTYTSEVLDGTDFTASYSIPAIFTSGISSVTLSLCKEDGTVLRSSDLGANSTWTSDGSADSNWPYLPSGNYIVKGQAVQEGTTVNFSEKNIAVSSPAFTVNTPSAHTSYNTYNDSGADAANAEDGSTIYGVANNGVKISDNILSNGNYTSLIGGYTYFIDGVNASEGENSGQTWAAHAVTAKFTFDGITAESPQLTCHVTGLPYTAAPPTNTGDHQWSKKSGTITWEADKVTLSWATASYPCVYSPEFYIPNDNGINVSAKTKIVRNKTNLNYNSTLGIWINENDKAYSSELTNGSTYENSIDTQTMTPTYNKWYIQYNYMASGPKTYIYYFNIYYR